MQPSMMHILEVVFALLLHSALHRAMEGNMYTIPEDFIIETDKTNDVFIFRGYNKKNVKYQGQEQVSLRSFKQFVAHQQLQWIPFGPNDWVNIK